MIRPILMVLLLLVPVWAQAYVVVRGAPLDEGQPSLFNRIDFPVSHFALKEQSSGSGSFATMSSFGLKNLNEQSRLRVEETLSQLDTRVEQGRLIVTLSGDVLFDFDKSDIRRDAQPILSRFAGVLQAMGDVSLTIVGHTDAKGSDAYNQALSERRAASVKKWLAEAGVKLLMSTQGKGKSEPVAPNMHANGSDNPAGRQKNRRVEFIIAE